MDIETRRAVERIDARLDELETRIDGLLMDKSVRDAAVAFMRWSIPILVTVLGVLVTWLVLR